MRDLDLMISITAESLLDLASSVSPDPTGALFAFAESCTGGLAASSIVELSGASDHFPGSVISYSNLAKIDLLGVDPATIERYGAVSGECALEMARGVREKLRAQIGVSITGIAGPSGGTPDKPVGTVWFAKSSDNGERILRSYFPNRSRTEIRKRSTLTALELVLSDLADRK